MARHPFDPVSAVLGILTILGGLLVVLGEAADVDTTGSWWFTAAAILAGLAIIPWRRRPTSITPAAPVPADEA
jgi:hypothetical protein